MGNSAQLKNLASQPPSRSFSPYRRRPLRSRTLHTLVQILSHCPFEGENGASVGQTREGVGTEIRGVAEQIGKCNHDQVKPVEQLDAIPNHKELEADLVRETDADKSKESNGCQNGGFEVGQPSSSGLSREHLVMENTEEVAGENLIVAKDSLMEENGADDSAEMIKELEDVNGILGFQTDGFSSMFDLETEKEFTVQDLCEVLNSSFDDDMNLQSSKVGENNKDAGSILDCNKIVGFEHDLQFKELELEKLISSPRVMGSNCQVEDEEIEEGEICGDAGSVDAFINELSVDAASPGDKSTELAHSSKDNLNKQVLICNSGERGHWRDTVPNFSIFNTSASDGGFKRAELREPVTQMQDSTAQNVLCHSNKMAKRSSPAEPCLEKSPSTSNLPENDAEDLTTVAMIQDGDVNKKKRKKGPLTKERKAKKKKKERIKRAENNRKLGINRLKLPVSKPKTPKPCRHYLHGRCHEAENCKFSHDVIPLTKSKPCSYFARQSCMKGDDCPFDHVLSKYPCDNYATKGFCSRGSDCLFSHTIQANQVSITTPSNSSLVLNLQQQRVPENKRSHMISDAPQPCIKLTSPTNNSNSSKNADNRDLFHRRVDAKFSSGGSGSDRKAEKLSQPARTAKHAPKGVSFLLQGEMPASDPSKKIQDGSSSNVGGGGAVVHEKILSGPVSNSGTKTNGMSVVEVPKKPRGINFLSFTQKSSLDETSSKTLSNLFTNVHNGKGKPSHLLADTASHLPDSGKSVLASKQMNLDAADLVQSWNKGANNTPQSSVPGPVNNTFPGETQSYNLVNQRISSSLRISPLSNTSGLVQKAVQSTLAFAAKFESNIKLDNSGVR